MAYKKVLPLISIDEIQIPGYLVDRLKSILPDLTNELQNNEIDINSGYLPYDISKLQYPDNINMLVFFWITENNEIIKTINLIFNDAREFVCEPHAYTKNQETRIKFYIRSIFYEIFRFREVFHSFLKKLRRYGIFTNKEVNDLKFDFGNQFK